METPTPLLVACAVIGLVIAAALWIMGVVPWWAIPVIAVLAPVAVFLVLIVLFYALWVASGSH